MVVRRSGNQPWNSGRIGLIQAEFRPKLGEAVGLKRNRNNSRDRIMTRMRAHSAPARAANDNHVASRRIFARWRPPQAIGNIFRPRSLRAAVRFAMIAGFSAFVLAVLSGAFLLGLALVGLFAATVAGLGLIRRHVPHSAAPML